MIDTEFEREEDEDDDRDELSTSYYMADIEGRFDVDVDGFGASYKYLTDPEWVRADYNSFVEWNTEYLEGGEKHSEFWKFADEITDEKIKIVQQDIRKYLMYAIECGNDNAEELFNSKEPETVEGAKYLLVNDPNFWYFLPDETKFNKEVILEMLDCVESETGTADQVEYFPKHILDDLDFIKECSKRDSFCPSDLPKDTLVGKIAQNCNGNLSKAIDTYQLTVALEKSLTKKESSRTTRMKL